MPDTIRSAGAARSSAVDAEPIAPVILLLAGLLKRSGNATYSQKLGLSSVAWTMIARLGDEGPMTQAQLAERILLDKGQLSRTAVALEKQRLISRESRTRRCIVLRLEPAGRKIFAAIQRISKARHHVLLAGVSARDRRVLYKTLAKINSNANTLLVQAKCEPG